MSTIQAVLGTGQVWKKTCFLEKKVFRFLSILKGFLGF